MSGRKHDCVWFYFDKTKVVEKGGRWATCKKYGKEMQGLVARILKKLKLIVIFKYIDFFQPWFEYVELLFLMKYDRYIPSESKLVDKSRQFLQRLEDNNRVCVILLPV